MNDEIFTRFSHLVRNVYDKEDYKSLNEAFDKDPETTTRWMYSKILSIGNPCDMPPIPENDDDEFSNCNHTRKMKCGDFHICEDCNYHFCYDDQKYSHPDQYKDCKHLVKGDIFGCLTCFRCGFRLTSIFSTCEHRRKKRFHDYSDFYCCADCEYHFVDGDPKLKHPSQYENCEHTDQRMVDNQLVCLRCGLRFTGPPPIPFIEKEKTKCEHSRLEKYNVTIFCVNCGQEKGQFYGTVYKRSHPEEKDNALCTDCSLFEKYESTDELCEDENKLTEHSRFKDLREAATNIGVKHVTTMSKKRLCEVLGIKFYDKGKYIIKNLKTGEEHEFKTQKEISDKLGVCKGSVSYLVKRKKKNFSVGKNMYSLRKNITPGN